MNEQESGSAEPMYSKGYIERLGTGILDILRISKEYSLKEPEFEQNESFKTILYRPSAPQVTQKYRRSSVEVFNLLKVIEGEMSRQEVQDKLNLKDRKNFRETYMEPALADGYIIMKFPDNPNHPKQKYLLTEKGKNVLWRK